MTTNNQKMYSFLHIDFFFTPCKLRILARGSLSTAASVVLEYSVELQSSTFYPKLCLYLSPDSSPLFECYPRFYFRRFCLYPSSDSIPFSNITLGMIFEVVPLNFLPISFFLNGTLGIIIEEMCTFDFRFHSSFESNLRYYFRGLSVSLSSDLVLSFEGVLGIMSES